jgi:hypothetical protein
MGRPRKTAEKKVEGSAALEFEPDAPVAHQKHRIVTEFVKTVPVEELNTDTDEGDLDEDINGETAAEAIEDPIEALLREIGASQSNWLLVVDRLPNYSKDGNWSPRAKWVRCGTIPLTPDLLVGESYVEEIQTRWARPGKPNDFRLCVRRDNKIFAYLPVLTLEPPEPEVLAKIAANEQPHQFNFQLPQQDNSLDSFLKQAEKLAKLKAVLGWGEPAQQAQQNPAAQPLTTEAALLHIVSADESLLEKAVGGLSKLFRRGVDEAREVGLMDIAFEAIKNNTLPQLVREFRAMMVEGAQLNGQAQIHPQNIPMDPSGGMANAHGQGVTQGPPGIRPPSDAGAGIGLAQPGSPADRPAGSGVPPEIQLLQFAITACAQQMPIAAAVTWINSHEDAHPGINRFIDMFLAMTPEEALQWFAAAVPQAQPLANAPHAKQWIADLQAGLRGDEPDGSSSPA